MPESASIQPDTKTNTDTTEENNPVALEELNKKLTLAVEEDKSEQILDAATAETIAIYSDAPINGPDWFIAKVAASAAFANRLPGTSSWTIGNGAGSLSNLTPQERAEQKEQEDSEWLDSVIEVGERAREQEREREEWQQATHRYAGVETTGAEWGALGDQLSGNTELRKWLVERIKGKGKTQAEAEKTADQVALLAKMQSMPKGQWTDEMKSLDEDLNQHPEKRKELDGYLEASATRKKSFAQTNEIERTTTTASQDASVTSGADAFDTDTKEPARDRRMSVASSVDAPNDISSPLDLKEHHQASLAATVPLDAPKAPMQIAALTPTPAPGGGFDS